MDSLYSWAQSAGRAGGSGPGSRRRTGQSVGGWPEDCPVCTWLGGVDGWLGGGGQTCTRTRGRNKLGEVNHAGWRLRWDGMGWDGWIRPSGVGAGIRAAHACCAAARLHHLRARRAKGPWDALQSSQSLSSQRRRRGQALLLWGPWLLCAPRAPKPRYGPLHGTCK